MRSEWRPSPLEGALPSTYAAPALSTRPDQPRSISIRSEHPRGAYAVRTIRGHGRVFLEALHERRELSVVLTTDRAIQALNRVWRKKNRPTDVLSFGAQAESGLLGDVVISLDTASRQAVDGTRPLTDELARLLAHGILHLLGHDHEQPSDARRMAKAELKLLDPSEWSERHLIIRRG